MAGNDPNHPRPPKAKKLTSSNADFGSSPWKHPDKVADTATSKAKEEEIAKVNPSEIMQAMILYRNRKGVYPFESPDDLQRFCTPYIHNGIGNAGGWLKKMEEMKNKFKNVSAPMAYVDKKEFELWKKIWGNKRDV